MAAILPYIPQLLQILLFLIMFGMGMTLTVGDFRRVGQFPRAVFIGLTNQIVLLPIVGLLIISVLPLRPEIAVGIMVVSACPGGATSNLISHLSRGDTALSITLTAISSLITIITIPLIINYALRVVMGDSGQLIQLPLWNTIVNIVKLTALPVILGMWINHRFPDFAKRSLNAIAWGSGTVVLLALALMVIKLAEIGDVWSFIKAAGLAVLCLNVLTFSIGFFSSRLLRLPTPQSITVSIESGMQNNVLGMAIAMAPTMLNNPIMAAPAGVYGIMMCAIGLGLIVVFRRISKNNQLEAEDMS